MFCLEMDDVGAEYEQNSMIEKNQKGEYERLMYFKLTRFMSSFDCQMRNAFYNDLKQSVDNEYRLRLSHFLHISLLFLCY